MPVRKYKTTANFIPLHGLEAEALQHTCERENKKEMWDFHREVCGAFGSKSIFITTSLGPTEAKVGDWVLKLPDGKFFVCGDAQFQTIYTLAE